MPELPEVANLARQMDRELRGRRVAEVDVVQPKCLNVRPDEFGQLLVHARVNRVTSRGKWIFVDLEPEATLLLNLGMGGETLFHRKGEPLPGNRQSAVLFDDGSALSQHFSQPALLVVRVRPRGQDRRAGFPYHDSSAGSRPAGRR